MSITETTVDRARRAHATLVRRTKMSRLGLSVHREMDADIIAMREAAAAFDALIKERLG